jgi:hypothetical protein
MQHLKNIQKHQFQPYGGSVAAGQQQWKTAGLVSSNDE